MKQTAVEWFVQASGRAGSHVDGDAVWPRLDPFTTLPKRAGFKLIDTRNEQTAGYIAECFGRLTRQPGICAVSSGMAHVNALSGVCERPFRRRSDAAGQRGWREPNARPRAFSGLPQVEMAAPVTCYSRLSIWPREWSNCWMKPSMRPCLLRGRLI